ncbi:ExbD/TolR family protein [Allorhodopirellula solitaria]|uniref:Biopolymer transport protein ExbD/TolR n=1 Tax=Allorhodopirellula solitaria TaxID=2527987 RepID=A0A5C5YHE3_9BACT|nr:biopolymer transporter ExbD [Allorhodopirellula solitaria]TWT74015.1 Biopolymer transport protein ExbD/TolR [Allorhodopirellula solitaria]
MKSPQSHRSATRRGQDRISMTPMIDIVFLLIIFFLVSSHLSRQETRHPVTLSEADAGELDDGESAALTITLDRDGKVFLASEVIPREDFPGRFAAYQESRASAADPSQRKVRLRVDRTLPYRDVEPILKELARQSVADVSIVVSPRDTASPSAVVP